MTSAGKNGLLDLLVRGCGDSDANVRKFSCFAIGNAAFHSDELYAALATSVPSLRQALHDEDEKTRANAAGALGNLCRNNGSLSDTLSREKAVEALMDMVTNDPSQSCKVSEKCLDL